MAVSGKSYSRSLKLYSSWCRLRRGLTHVLGLHMSARLNCRSPSAINSHLRVIVKYLDLDEGSAVQLKYRKPAGFIPEVDNCHFNCWVAWDKSGGAIQHGWILSQDRSQDFSEAIFHSVLKKEDGSLVDVTPRKDGERRLLFIPDQNRQIVLTQYNGLPAIRTYDNVRLKGSVLLTGISEVIIVPKSDFAKRYGLLR